jgi:streptomycin 6-kinase
MIVTRSSRLLPVRRDGEPAMLKVAAAAEERAGGFVMTLGLIGERGFDYANLFCNPTPYVALAPGRLAHQVELVATAARLDRQRLLAWAVAWAGLSAAWHIADRTDPATALAVATLALGLLPT